MSRLLPCFEHMSECDPAGAEMAQERLWKEFAEAAGCTVWQLKQYHNRVHHDGMSGPYSDEAWKETANGEECNMADAQAALGRAWGITPDVHYTHPEYPDEDLSVCEDDILASYFPGIRNIYGCYPDWGNR